MSDAALRYELAGELGSLIWDRQEIVGLVQAHAPTLAVADLPQGSARTLWTHVLVELANRNDAKALSALLEEGARRSKRVAWTKYEVLAAVPAPGGTWSLLAVDLWWNDERGERRAVAHVARDQVIVEAEATLQWSGTRPPDPQLAFELGPLIGARRRETAAWQPSGSIAGVASWSARLPIPPAAFSTSRITAIAGDRRAVRYLLARSGYFVTLALWLALAGFIALWLAPLGMPVAAVGLGIWVALFGFGWLVPRIRELAGPLSWITRAWETTAPLVALLAGLTVALPPLLLVMVFNRSAEPVAVAGDLVEPTGRRTLLGHPDLSAKRTTQCICPIEPACRCDEEPVRFVSRYEVQCRSVLDEKCSDLMRVTLAAMIDPPPPAGTVRGDATVPLDWPTGFERMQFTRRAFASSMKLSSGAQQFELTNVQITDRAPSVLALKVLAEQSLTIEFPDRSTLRCALPSVRTPGTVAVIDVAPRVDLELELAKASGAVVTSRWHTGGPELTRVCLAQADVATITIARPRAGQRIRLPDTLGIESIRFGRSRDPFACRDPNQLRVVANRNPGLKLPFAHGVLDDDVVATCIPAGFRFRASRAVECELGEDEITCRGQRSPDPDPHPGIPGIPTHPSPGIPPRLTLAPYEGPCTFTARGELKAVESPNCRKLEHTDPLWKHAIELGRGMSPRKLLCSVVFFCQEPPG